MCDAGSFCPNISSVPQTCASGSYSLGSAVKCTECPAGYKCPNLNSRPIPCEAGKYSNKSFTSCLSCDAGFICKGSNTSPRPIDGRCPIGYYCTDGKDATPCPAGTYGNTTGAPDAASGCGTCPAGYFCPRGTSGYPTYRYYIGASPF